MDNLYKLEILKAIENKLLNTDAFFERKIRRWYSKNFYTPLHEVLKLPWLFILRNYYESMIEDLEYDKVYDMAVKEYIEELANEIELEDEEFARQLEEKIQKENEKRKEKVFEKDPDPEPEKPIVKLPEDLPNINMTFEEEEYE